MIGIKIVQAGLIPSALFLTGILPVSAKSAASDSIRLKPESQVPESQVPESQIKEAKLSSERFLDTAFKGDRPRSKTLWLKGDVRPEVNRILGHSKYPGLRVRYWRVDERTVWILDEIGKYKPITTGIIIQDGQIEKLQVLAYRESHGWEVKHDFFTRQFIGARLVKRDRLSETIDGISGATLSVRALKNLAHLALYFDEYVRETA